MICHFISKQYHKTNFVYFLKIILVYFDLFISYKNHFILC